VPAKRLIIISALNNASAHYWAVV